MGARAIGNAGYDALEGGANTDTFRFLTLSESLGDATCDRVLDFASEQDLIDLRKIDANTLAAGDDAFTFSGKASLSGVAGELVARTTAAGTTVLRGDVDGDRVADFQLVLLETSLIETSDFCFDPPQVEPIKSRYSMTSDSSATLAGMVRSCRSTAQIMIVSRSPS